jgi:hypothetical protein
MPLQSLRYLPSSADLSNYNGLPLNVNWQRRTLLVKRHDGVRNDAPSKGPAMTKPDLWPLRLRFDKAAKRNALNAGDRYRYYRSRGFAVFLGSFVFHVFIGREVRDDQA